MTHPDDQNSRFIVLMVHPDGEVCTDLNFEYNANITGDKEHDLDKAANLRDAVIRYAEDLYEDVAEWYRGPVVGERR